MVESMDELKRKAEAYDRSVALRKARIERYKERVPEEERKAKNREIQRRYRERLREDPEKLAKRRESVCTAVKKYNARKRSE